MAQTEEIRFSLLQVEGMGSVGQTCNKEVSELSESVQAVPEEK